MLPAHRGRYPHEHPDIAAVRITCGRVSDTYRIAARLSELSDVTLIEVEDYIAKPKPNGYKSLHMIVEIPVSLSNRVEQVPVELQIRTIAQDLWASCEHTISYKYPCAIPGGLLDTLTQAADAAYRLDMKMERLLCNTNRTMTQSYTEPQWDGCARRRSC